MEPSLEYIAPSEKIKVAWYYIGEVAKYIERKGEGFFLISYKVDDLPRAMEELKEKKVKLIDDKPREIFGNRYAFIHHPSKLSGVLTELIEGEFDMNKQS